jgi:hypothetical protein
MLTYYSITKNCVLMSYIQYFVLWYYILKLRFDIMFRRFVSTFCFDVLFRRFVSTFCFDVLFRRFVSTFCYDVLFRRFVLTFCLHLLLEDNFSKRENNISDEL